MECKCCEMRHKFKPTGRWEQLCPECFNKNCPKEVLYRRIMTREGYTYEPIEDY